MINYQKGWTQIETTDFCNLSCIMCEQGGKVDWNPQGAQVHQNKKGFISLKLWEKIISDFSQMGKWWEISPFWLGEATLHPQFDQLVDTLTLQNTFQSFQLHTNFNILTSKIEKSLQTLFSTFSFAKIFISTDAITQTTYQKIRCGGDFKKVLKNTLRLLEMKKKYNFTFKLIIQFIVMPENHRESQEFYFFWKDVFKFYSLPFKVITQANKHLLFDYNYPINNYLYFEVLNTQSYEKEKNFKLYQESISFLENLTSNKEKNKQGTTNSSTKEKKKTIFLEKDLKQLKKLGDLWLNPIQRTKKLLEKSLVLLKKAYSSPLYVKPCAFIFYSPYISWNGNVTICCLDNRLDLKQGNLSKTSLKELWEGKNLTKIRINHIFNNYERIERCFICITRGQRKQNREEITLDFAELSDYLHALCK